MPAQRFFAGLVAAAALTAVIVATAAPLLASKGRVEAVPLYLALEYFCHQLPERSWSIGDLQAGLCVRCFGLYGGIALAAIGGFRFSKALLAAGVIVIGLTWAVEAVGVWEPAQWARFFSGAAFGLAAGAVLQLPEKRPAT
jgi:uncharacterized membrane protein